MAQKAPSSLCPGKSAIQPMSWSLFNFRVNTCYPSIVGFCRGLYVRVVGEGAGCVQELFSLLRSVTGEQITTIPVHFSFSNCCSQFLNRFPSLSGEFLWRNCRHLALSTTRNSDCLLPHHRQKPLRPSCLLRRPKSTSRPEVRLIQKLLAPHGTSQGSEQNSGPS